MGGWPPIRAITFVAACCATTPAVAQADRNAASFERLDSAQQALAKYKSLTYDAIGSDSALLHGLLQDYLRAFAPHLESGGAFDLTGGTLPQLAFESRLERDFEEWHSLFRLIFVKSILDREPRGMYALMLCRSGAEIDEAIAWYRSARAEARPGNPSVDWARAERRHRQVLEQNGSLWNRLSTVTRDRLVSVLVDGLGSYAGSDQTSGLLWSVEILDRIFGNPAHREFEAAIRGSGSSDALAVAIHRAALELIADADLPLERRLASLDNLLHVLVLLQTPEARDRLLLLFDELDVIENASANQNSSLQATLVHAVVDFVERSVREDPEHVLALDVIDQLTIWLIEDVELVHPVLYGRRIVMALWGVRNARPEILEAYIRRFYRDFHALAPAGYESIIFHLTGILVDYAVHGDFVLSVTLPAGQPPASQTVQEQVLELLRWFNQALVEIGPTLPRIDVFFMRREQRDVLNRIYDFFELEYGSAARGFGNDDPRLIVTMLHLVKRIAHAAHPADIERHILEPFDAIAEFHRTSPRRDQRDCLTAEMKQVLDFLRILASRHRLIEYTERAHFEPGR